MADPSSLKSNKCSKKARIIGRIRGFTEQELKSVDRNSNPWITVKNSQKNGSNEKSTVFFEMQSTSSRKDVYELDYCYEQADEIDMIYSREVKPLILEAFDGQNVSIIALGPRGSGKTYTLQGSEEKPGLVVMAMPEILSRARDSGKLVYVSIYEMTQEHAYDILDPNCQEVQVMEDGHGKINFKGLSQVHVKSISEFHGMYFTQKAQMDQRKHKGVMLHILCEDHKSKSRMASKINFVDLAGYQDPKKGGGLAEINRTNKSLYALLNVVNALNANEIRMPYRESKITRILQDSLGGTCNVLLLTCLNPTICQETVTSLSLVSRSYRNTQQVLVDSTNRSQSIGKQKVPSSLKSGKTMSTSLSVKKMVSQSHLRDTKKASYSLKGRKLFDDKKRINSKQLVCQSENTSAHKSKILQDLALIVSPFSLEEAQPHKSVFEICPPIKKEEDENLGLEFQSMSKLDTSFPGVHDDKAVILAEKDVSPGSQINHPEASLDEKSLTSHKDAITCEKTNIFHKEGGSPPLSERIREISNNLKALCSSTPLRIKMVEEKVVTSSNYDILEPKTPVTGLGRVKDTLVHEYLKFLNSASKDELKGLRGIGEKRANYIIELREDSPEPFKNLDDLQDLGLSAKQVKGMMKQVAGELFN